MAWYDRFIGRNAEEKANPAQYVIARDQGTTIQSVEVVHNYRSA